MSVTTRSTMIGVSAVFTSLNRSVSAALPRSSSSSGEDGFSAFLLVKEGNATAFVNRDHHPNRQRFSLAHEIGHFILHHQPSKKLDDLFLDKSLALYTRKDHHSNEMERQANEFAASLLMPRELLEKYIAKNDLDMEDEFDVSRLAMAFGVSEQALQIRLNKLHLVFPNF